MNYDKNAAKHYDLVTRLSAEETNDPCGDIVYAARLLYALCAYFSALGKPAPLAEKLSEMLVEKLPDLSDVSDPEALGKLTEAANALSAYHKMTADETVGNALKTVFGILTDGLFSEILDGKDGDKGGTAKNDRLSEISCNALPFVAENRILNAEKSKRFAGALLPLFSDENHTFESTIYAFNGAIGLLSMTKTAPSLLSLVLAFAKNLAAKNANLDYSFNKSQDPNDKTADPVATSLAMRFYTEIYKTTGDRFFLYIVRRIWFNAMQFFERQDGYVGYDNPPRAPEGLLSVKTYKEKTLTPAFCHGLCAYEKNKGLFAEYDAPVKKDPRGRYVVDDKIFAREQGGYFGRDLIEIPSLLSFDEETASGFVFKLLF